MTMCLIITFSPFQAFTAYGESPSGTVKSTEPSVKGELPTQFDLRDRGVVTPVKRQEPWGNCWAYAAIASAETSILSAMGSTYEETGLDLSERYLAWYVTSPVTEAISKSQAGEGLHVYNTEAGANHVYDFGGREQCAATLFAQGVGPVAEQDCPNRGAEGKLALEDLRANKDAYIELRVAMYKDFYPYADDGTLREMAEDDYESCLRKYEKYDSYSPLDDWSINEPDEPGSGKLRGSSYTLTDNSVFNYWARINDEEIADYNKLYNKEPLYIDGNHILYQDSIDQIKTEIYAGHAVSVGLTLTNQNINRDTWAAYDSSFALGSSHESSIVGWDDDFAASNFSSRPPGKGAWIVKNSWGSETDLVPGGLTAADGTAKDANGNEWGIVDSQGRHTGYFYLSYFDTTIMVPESFGFRIEANNDYQDALQLDYLPASVGEWFHMDEKPMWEANIFTLEKDMRIEEVATRIRMDDDLPITGGFTCEFALYKLNEGATKPDDGELVATATRTFENQGYHRTALDAPVYLNTGDRLGIVVRQSRSFDDGITRYSVDAHESDGYREIHRDPVYGTPVLNQGESFWKCDGLTDQEEASQEGWLDMTAPLSRELLLYLKPDVAKNPDMLDYYTRNYVGKPISEFFNLDNFCIKAFGEPYTPDQVCPRDDTCPMTPFTDTDRNAWYHDGVHWALEKSVMNGTGENTFEPMTPTTRAMLVTMLWRMEGSPGVNYQMSFKDVADGKWYTEAIRWAAAEGIVTGYNKETFGIKDPVTREQLATILYRSVQAKGSGFTGGWAFPLDFDDADQISDWADEAMHWMVMTGVINGVSDKELSPKTDASRAQVATMLMRFDNQVQAQKQDVYLTLVNKTHKLPDNWLDMIELVTAQNSLGREFQVEKEALEHFVQLREAMLNEGIDIELDSTYRSVQRQEELWAEFEEKYGLEYCQKYVAVPGYSEHHTGLAIDVCLIKDGEVIDDNDAMIAEKEIFAKVHEKLADYGFILRYLPDKVDVTGYAYEPWHFRYVGEEAAKKITEQGITLEEYLENLS